MRYSCQQVFLIFFAGLGAGFYRWHLEFTFLEMIVIYKGSSKTPIKRHIKIRSEANPYNPEFNDYFKQRKMTSKTRRSQDQTSTLDDYKLLGDTFVALPRA